MGAEETQGRLSPDGLWRWDGTRWLATDAVAATDAGIRSPGRRRSWIAIAGGIAALVAVPVMIAGSVLPFVFWTDTSNGQTSSVFNPGYAGGFWFGIEPVVVMFCVLPAAIVLIAATHRVIRAVAAGALLAFGVQTLMMFVGYSLGELSFGRIGPGGPIGLVGAAILFTGGALGLGSLIASDAPQHASPP